MKVIVASKNPVKIKATRDGFRKMFPGRKIVVEAVTVTSAVSHQPLSDGETFQGALARCQKAKAAYPQADFWVGIEGGVEEKQGEMEVFAWILIAAKSGLIGKGRTGTFFLPPAVQRLIKQGKELGEADDIVFGRKNSKQKNGAVGLLTGDIITRTSYYTPAVILALIPFRNPKLYQKQ